MQKNVKRKTEPVGARSTAPIVNDRALHQAIADKAYDLYQKRGRGHGRDLEDWLEAERAVLSEFRQRAS